MAEGLQYGFSCLSIEHHEGKALKCIDELDSQLTREAHDGIALSATEVLLWFTFDITGNFTFSKSSEMLERQQSHHIIVKTQNVRTLQGALAATPPWLLHIGVKFLPRILWLKDWYDSVEWYQDQIMEILKKGHTLPGAISCWLFVGENLQNHLFTGLVFEAVDDVHTFDAFFRQEPDAVVAAMQDYGTKGTGPMSTSNMTTMAQLPLPEFHTEERRKDIDLLLGSLDPNVSRLTPTTPAFAAAHETFVRSILTQPSRALGNYVFGSAYAPFDAPSPTYRAPGKYVSVSIDLSHPLSRGYVPITSAKAELAGTNEGVSVDCRYLSHPLDLEVLARQIRFTEDIVTRAEPIARNLKPYTKRFTDLEQSKEYARRTVDGAYHYTGTCSMMPRAMGGVVDNRLRVHGCSNLRVLDASILSLEPTANP